MCRTGADEDFLFCEESFLRRNWEQWKGFLSMKNHYLEGIGCRERIFYSMKNNYGEGIGCIGRFPLL
jgi:hypothetical protein